MKRLWTWFCRLFQRTQSSYGQEYQRLLALERTALRHGNQQMYAYAKIRRVRLLAKINRLAQMNAAKMQDTRNMRIVVCKRCGE